MQKKSIVIGATLAAALLALVIRGRAAQPESIEVVLDQTMTTLDGEEINLAERYADRVVLFVNVASKCGFTPQYAKLQALHAKYAERGLAIVGVPCNQFGFQEPGTADQIATFCEKNYGVEFDMLSKVDVRGPNQCPLYQALTAAATPSRGVRWNFEKFLVSREGKVVGRYGSKADPMGESLTEAVERELSP